MPRPRSANSDMSEGDLEVMVEQELQKLQRQFRLMEGDRAAYTEESQNLIRRQKREISHLECEKQELMKELRLAESHHNQNMDEDNTDTLVTLAQAKEDYDSDIADEKRKAVELDAKIKEWDRKIHHQHKNMGGIHMSSQHTVQTQKTIRTLENRLDTAKKTFNAYLTENSKYREEIESLRVERTRFDGLYKKLDKELTVARREKGELIESSTQAYDARDEAQAKMILLKEKADKDMQQHNAEMKELLQAIEADRKKESQEDSVETYEAAFERIREMTNETDLDLLVAKFIEVEDRNFALFNFVNEQNNEIETLQEQIEDINNEIEKFKLQGIELEDQRKKILKELEEQSNTAAANGDAADGKNKGITKILDQLRAGISSLFSKINCDKSAIDDMLGAASGVTDSNMIQYLGIIEQRTNELLAVQGYVNSKDLDKKLPVGAFLGEGPNPPQSQLPIIPPAVGDEYDSEGSEGSDDEARPMTRNELQRRVMNTVKKREAAAKKQENRYDLSNAKEKTAKNKKDKK
ncbi:coiled-coil domain-containing protein 63-like [Ylistrum balloti]|uniref:coiled-coil domain-containing protein 63-like n=1 Tax=Ylistrum balloti TaxID=509963 RepID=UPI0029058EDE|nr:coiled-coil domain-containing protein 63-like [Ylistrum balloti]